MLDFHNHLIPGVDDGAESLAQSLDGVRAMQRAGISHVITTPHFRASISVDPRRFEVEMHRIDEAWRTLDQAAKTSFPGLTLARGVELALDERIDRIPDERLTLGSSGFVLVEFPAFSIPPFSSGALGRLRNSGVIPIVAHPERYHNVGPDLGVLREWREAGAFLQMNCGSVVGAYGKHVQQAAWRILAKGMADFLCSDYHSRGECLTTVAEREFNSRGSAVQFEIMARTNGVRMLSGLLPLPVPPTLGGKPKGWRRFLPFK